MYFSYQVFESAGGIDCTANNPIVEGTVETPMIEYEVSGLGQGTRELLTCIYAYEDGYAPVLIEEKSSLDLL